MFSTGIRTNHHLFLRQSEKPIDKTALSLFVKHNMPVAKAKFFSHNMACSWSSTLLQQPCEVLFVISPMNHIITESRIFDICREMTDNITVPDYESYSSYVSATTCRTDIISNLNRFALSERCTLLPAADYAVEIAKIKEAMMQPFTHISRFVEAAPKQQSSTELADIESNVIAGKLCFMGLYFDANDTDSLKDVLAYKLLEKVYGTNESTSIYYSLRQQGTIYTGITTYYMEKNRLITGVMGVYSAELRDTVKKLISSLTIDEIMLQQAKESLYNEIKYLAFQNGEMFTLFPYYSKLKRIVTLDEIKLVLELLSMGDLFKHIPPVMSSINVGES